MKHWAGRCQAGQSLQEYATVLVLVAMLSIGALKLFGGNISGLFNHAGDHANNGIDKLYATIGASPIVDAKGAPIAGSSATQLAANNQVTLSLDPKTGEVLINGAPRSDTNATSTDGMIMTALASQIGMLAQSPAAMSDPKVQDLLKQLQASGEKMAAMPGYLDQNKAQLAQLNTEIGAKIAAGQYNGPPYYDAATVQAVAQYTDQYVAFSKTYQALNAYLSGVTGNSPEMAALQKQVSDYAGGLSTMAHSDIGTPLFSNFHEGFAQTSDLMTAMKSTPNAAPLFMQLEAKTALLPPAQKDAVFSQQVLQLGEQMKVGTPITSASGLQLAIQPTPPIGTASR